jgi:hypothetical protein
MIIYDLKCNNNHQFESWFKNSDFFQDQKKAKKIECPFCGSFDIDMVFSPLRILKSDTKDTTTKSKTDSNPEKSKAIINTNNKNLEQLRKITTELQKEVAKHCDYVGNNFAEEARKIHYGEKKAERGIYGETTKEEVKSLKEEGIDFMALPVPKTDA